jgi:bifunctional non-homologous end joining protein LigD
MSRASRRLHFIEPQLLTLTGQPPQGSEWMHEVKHDGYRTLVVIEAGCARAYTRSGLDWSES